MPFSSFHIQGYILSTRLITVMLNMVCLTEVLFVRFSIPQGFLGNPLSILNSLEESHNAYPMLKEASGLCFTSIGGMYLYKLFGIQYRFVCSSLLFVVKSSISITMKLMDIYFYAELQPRTRLLLFGCSNFPAMAPGSSFSWLGRPLFVDVLRAYFLSCLQPALGSSWILSPCPRISRCS